MPGDEAYQAARAEETGELQSFTVRGKQFRLEPNPPQWAFLELISKGNLELGESSAKEQAEAYSAVYDYLRSIIIEDDWGKFRRHMMSERLTLEQVAEEALWPAAELVLGRPTEPPPPSDVLPSSNGATSTASSSPTEPAAQHA